MTWLRVGDTIATDPRVRTLATLDPDDPRLQLEAVGFLLMAASLSAAHQTDGIIDAGAALLLAGARGPVLLKALTTAKLVEPKGRGRARYWKILDDPGVLHIRLRAAVEWEAQQRSDTRSVHNKITCLLRDGDACRWCGKVVQPHDNLSARGRTLDHVIPMQAAGGPEGLVVACRECNGARGKEWQDEELRGTLATRWTLLPAPPRPYWAPSTIAWLLEQGHDVATASGPRPADDAPATRGPASDHPSDPAPRRAPLAPPSDPAPRRTPLTRSQDVAPSDAPPITATRPPQPHSDPDPAQRTPEPPQPHSEPGTPTPDPRQTHGSGTASPGRVGTGRVGPPPGTPHPPASPSAQPRPARRPRGRRGSRRPPGANQ